VTVIRDGAATCNNDFIRTKQHLVFLGGADCYDALTVLFLWTICETFVNCYTAVTCYCLTRITFPSQSFNEKQRLFCTTLIILK